MCGDNPLAHRLVEELTARLGRDVTVILRSKKANHGPDIARMPNVRVIEAPDLTDDVFRLARIDGAQAVALVDQDDLGNLHSALRAQELQPHIRLVLRMFNMQLGNRVRKLFTDCAVLSDAALASPWFVAAALGELTPNHVQLPGRTLYVGRRSEVAADRVLCGLADTRGPGPARLLPIDQDSADLVLAGADRAPNDPLADYRRPRRLLAKVSGGFKWLVNRKLRVAFLAVLGLLAVGTVVFATLGHYTWADAIYLTVLDAAGAAQPESRLGVLEKITQVMVTIVGISLIPVLTAAVVDAVVGARLAGGGRRLRKPVSGHVVVVGLGNVGSRVIEQIHALGVPVVCIDSDPDARGIAVARRLGIPVIMGDVNQDETLRQAHVHTSQALVSVTSDDITNLQAGLFAREAVEDLRVVLRLFDGDFAERVQRNFDVTISRSVSFLAAPAFAAAMVEREVIGTIAVGRQVVLIADVPIGQDSELVGRTVRDAAELGEARVIALGRRDAYGFDWQPSPGHRLAGGDRLIVAATRLGLGHLLSRSITPLMVDNGDGDGSAR